MNTNTLSQLMAFVSVVPDAVCRCNLRERDSGHRTDCSYPEMQERADELVKAIRTDETLPIIV